MTRNVRGIRYAIVGAFVAACAASGAALAVDVQVAPDCLIAGAQPLVVDPATRSVTVTGFLKDGGADFYCFWARGDDPVTMTPGDSVTFDIDSDGSIDSWLSVLAPAPALTLMRSLDDSLEPQLDTGSSSSFDPYIKDFGIPADGIYYVVVTAQPNIGSAYPVMDGGVTSVSSGNATGNYTLTLTNVSPIPAKPDPVPVPDPIPVPQVRQINIDIKPGHGVLSRIDPKSRHAIPVALLSSASFNALAVDRSSLTFGHTGNEHSLRKCAGRAFDVNRDGRPDLVCEFANNMAEFEVSDEEGIIKGRTADGAPFEGRGILKVIRTKRHRFEGHKSEKNSRHDDDNDRDDRFPHYKR
jgi:hypothetical protein